MGKQKTHLYERQEAVLNEELDRQDLLKVEIYCFLLDNENSRELGWTGMRLALHEVLEKIERDVLKANASAGHRPSKLREAQAARDRFLKEVGW